MTSSHGGAVALGITASDRAFSVALRSADGSVHVSDAAAAKGATDLAAVVAAMFEHRAATPVQLTEIRLDVGPGSYTGLRVAVTFARVAAHFCRIPVHTTTSLELMALAAWNANAADATDRVLPILDARRKRFHHAVIRMDESTVLVDEPRATELPELMDSIRTAEKILTTGTVRAKLNADIPDTAIVEPVPYDAALLFDPRLSTRSTALAELEPLYLMGSYAESPR